MMGFLDYALTLSLQKDEMKTRIRVDPRLQQPTITHDHSGFTIALPLPKTLEDGSISFLRYKLNGPDVQTEVGRLFRACVFHLTTHTLVPTRANMVFQSAKHAADTFSMSLVRDIYVSSYISRYHAEKFLDIAFANTLAFAGMKTIERIYTPATRLMTALLSKVNIGLVKGTLPPREQEVFHGITETLAILKQRILSSMDDAEINIEEELSDTEEVLIHLLESHGPILESPSLPHTEETGPTTIFPSTEKPATFETDIFNKSLECIVGSQEHPVKSDWTKEVDVEVSQAFASQSHQEARMQKTLDKAKKYIVGTKFRSVDFPEEDYSQYLRARSFLRGGSRRLLDSLRVAKDALDEDPRKEMGQLDLTEVIQKVASQSPRTDVFQQNEYLSRSFAWGVLFDASASMRTRGELGRALAICVAEATQNLLMDPGSWTFFAFNDRFHILKDVSEAYSRRVRARIGGLRFDGLTYMPDAIRVGGGIVAQRFENQRFLIVLSDGIPYGYPNINDDLSESIKSIQKKGVIVIGVGLESEKMKNFFRLSCAVYNQKDLIKQFSKIFISASTTSLET